MEDAGAMSYVMFATTELAFTVAEVLLSENALMVAENINELCDSLQVEHIEELPDGAIETVWEFSELTVSIELPDVDAEAVIVRLGAELMWDELELCDSVAVL